MEDRTVPGNRDVPGGIKGLASTRVILSHLTRSEY